MPRERQNSIALTPARCSAIRPFPLAAGCCDIPSFEPKEIMKAFRFLVLVTAATLLTGCVERRYVITSDPPGAIVFRNGQQLGATPVDDHFVYYGKYNYTLVKDGYETLQVEQNIPAPWFEYFPIDFFSENLLPWQIEDVRRFHFKMEPRRVVNTNDLLKDAQNLRNRGLSISPPAPTPPATTLPAPTPVPTDQAPPESPPPS